MIPFLSLGMEYIISVEFLYCELVSVYINSARVPDQRSSSEIIGSSEIIILENKQKNYKSVQKTEFLVTRFSRSF